MVCPVCSSLELRLKYQINSYEILLCDLCGHEFTRAALNENLAEDIFSDDYFNKGKNGYPDYTLQKDILINRGEFYARMAEQYIQGGKMLDVGAAAGFIMKGFENRGWEVEGIELNRSMAEYGQTHLGLKIYQGSAEQVEICNKYDLVIMIQIIAHLFDVRRSMGNIRDRVTDNGYILIETVNKDSFTARVFGKSWHAYSPPSTMNYFSKKTLDIFLRDYGFRKIREGRLRKILHGTHAKEIIKHKALTSDKLKYLTIIEKMIPSNIRIVYPLDDIFWSLYQKE